MIKDEMDEIDSDLSTWSTFKRLWPRIRPFVGYLVIVSFCLIINGLSDTYLLSLIQPLLDKGFASDSERSFLFTLAFVVLGLFLIRGISNYVASYTLAWMSGKIVMKIRQDLFSHLVYSPVSFFDKNSTGRLLSRITYDSEQVASSATGALIVVIRETVYLLGLIGVMFYNSWQLSIILLVIGPLVGLLIAVISRRFRKLSKNIQTSMGNATATAEQMLRGHKEVLIFGAQKAEIEQFEKASNHLRRQGMKMVSIAALSTPFVQLIASIALAFILIMASYPDINLTAGQFTVVFSAMIALMKPLKELTNVNANFQRGMAACQTLFHLLDTPLEQDTGEIELTKAKGDIEFKQVSFTYPTREIPALVNVDFKVPAGKTIALVGRSGSGKSTIASLLTRFYDISEGEIRIDGRNVHDYTLASLRSQIGLVSQNVHLFHDTIANNIAYAKQGEYSRQQIEKAAELAHAMDFIHGMEKGLDTIIGENGVLLSGGQRQRVAIARALLRDNPILILDEATSALDTESERAIQEALNELQKNRTSIVIAHRLSTIENADQILVVSDGQIIEQGNHPTLLAQNGAYAQLHKMQFKE